MLLHTYYYIRPGGGPAGYLWNLKSLLDDCDSQVKTLLGVLPFYSDPEQYPRVNPSNVHKFGSIKSLRPLIAIYGALRRRARKLPERCVLDGKPDVLVLHSTDLAYRFLRTNNNEAKRGQRLYIMPHAPTDESEEAISMWASVFGDAPRATYLRVIRRFMAEAELSVFENVEGIIVPCIESLESYFVYDPVLRSRFERRLRQLIVYELPTGIVPLPMSSLDRYNAKLALGIPGERVVVAYFGRYHQHKGFPLFRNLVEYADLRHDNFYFVSAGEGHEKIPRSKKYKNLGWINRAELTNVMAAVDVVLFPNLVAYFDLALLESMSMGKVILVRDVGGHRKVQAPGIIKMKSTQPDEWYWELRKLNDNNLGKLSELGEANKRIFDAEYSQKAFLERHIQLAIELAGKESVIF
ncbi:MAG: glycosyltransferase family 4 protein [Alicyclobacillus sp.]|nr:glycosyltransferase family 4 protein [Alicyclobacillus sp.]